MIDFEGIRRDQAEWRRQAQQTFLPGIDPADLRVGMKVTISPNLRTGDRSYTTSVGTILAFNSTHIQLEGVSYATDRPVILVIPEHHFYDASAFVAEKGGE